MRLLLLTIIALLTVHANEADLIKDLNLELKSLQSELNQLNTDSLQKRLGFEKQLKALDTRISTAEEQLADNKKEHQLALNKHNKKQESLSLEKQALESFTANFTHSNIDHDNLALGQKLYRKTALVLEESNGQSIEGELFYIGHFAALFLAKGQNKTAWLNPKNNDLNYVEDTTSEENLQALKSLSKGQAALVTVDLSNSAAFRLKQHTRNWIDELKAGGTTVLPLLILGFICIVIAIIKGVQLYLTPNKFNNCFESVLPLIKDGKIDDAQINIDSCKGPAKVILQECLSHHEATKEELEELISESIMQLYGKLNRLLSVISISAATAPLLGLLGTVMGIIATFDLIAVFGTGDASRLSSGISEALITTKLGLIVAVPCLIIYSILSRRVKSIIFNLEHASLTFINNLKIRK